MVRQEHMECIVHHYRELPPTQTSPDGNRVEPNAAGLDKLQEQ
jgi:hypothetical protein